MPHIVIRLDGAVVQEFTLTRFRTTVGRRHANDVILDSQEVSAEHAVLQLSGGDVYLEDEGSTNGTYVNGKAVVKEQLLRHQDVIGIGPFVIEYAEDDLDGEFEHTMSLHFDKKVPIRPVAQQSRGVKWLKKLLSFFSLQKPK